MISSAEITVESLWAMTSVVRPRLTRSRAAWRRLEDRAGDRHALLLTAGKLQPAFAHHGPVAVGQAFDEAADLCEPRCLPHLLLGSAGPAVADVISDRVVEEHGILRNHADGGAQALLGDVAQILPVDQDSA
jgi:hypothetical protein